MSLAGLKVKVSGLHSFWKVPGQNLFPCLFQLLETAHIPWFGVSFHLQRQQSHHSACLGPMSSDSPASPFIYKDSCDHSGSAWIIQKSFCLKVHQSATFINSFFSI